MATAPATRFTTLTATGKDSPVDSMRTRTVMGNPGGKAHDQRLSSAFEAPGAGRW